MVHCRLPGLSPRRPAHRLLLLVEVCGSLASGIKVMFRGKCRVPG